MDYNVGAKDGIACADTSSVPVGSAADSGKASDVASASRALIVSASDSAGACDASYPDNPASDSATFSDAATIFADFGRFRIGDWVPLSLSSATPPDAAPVIIILNSDNVQVAAMLMPSSTPDGLNFFLPLQVNLSYAVGTFQVFYHYTIAGTAELQQAQFEVVPGGDSGGAVISMYSIDRPEVRSLVAQLDSGVLVLGRSPTVKE